MPTILTTVESKSFSGSIWPQLLDIFPDQEPVERSSMNSWEDEKFVADVKATGRKKLIMAALWTEVCLAFPAGEFGALAPPPRPVSPDWSPVGAYGGDQHSAAFPTALPKGCACHRHSQVWLPNESRFWGLGGDCFPF